MQSECELYMQLNVNSTCSLNVNSTCSLNVNSTCSQNDNLNMFPSQMKISNVPHFEILGAPIRDAIFCAKVVSEKCTMASKLLTQLSSVDPQIALLLLRQCMGFCKLVHMARSTPSLVVESFMYFDLDVCHCFALCIGVDTSNSAWKQDQLSLSRGGIGLWSITDHSAACYIASLSMSGGCSTRMSGGCSTRMSGGCSTRMSGGCSTRMSGGCSTRMSGGCSTRMSGGCSTRMSGGCSTRMSGGCSTANRHLIHSLH